MPRYGRWFDASLVSFLAARLIAAAILTSATSAAASAAAPIKLNGPLVAGGVVSSSGLQFSPDSSRVLYLADQDTDNVFEIYSVLSTGGTPVKLNAPAADQRRCLVERSAVQPRLQPGPLPRRSGYEQRQ